MANYTPETVETMTLTMTLSRRVRAIVVVFVLAMVWHLLLPTTLLFGITIPFP
jgi:hypothetical protein